LRCGEWHCCDCFGSARTEDGEPICSECVGRIYAENLRPQPKE
jgi:hypothetical protein